MKKMFNETGLYFTVSGNGVIDEWISIYSVPSCAPWSFKGCYRLYYGNKGRYIRYNRTTYYFD